LTRISGPGGSAFAQLGDGLRGCISARLIVLRTIPNERIASLGFMLLYHFASPISGSFHRVAIRVIEVEKVTPRAFVDLTRQVWEMVVTIQMHFEGLVTYWVSLNKVPVIARGQRSGERRFEL
jgi:hypothetical protein